MTEPETVAGPILSRAYESLYRGDYAAALAAFEDHFREAPLVGQDPLIVRDYANQLALNGQPERALELLERALQVHPGFAEFRVSRGQVLLSAGRRGEARTAFAEAVATDPAIRCPVYTLLLSLTLEAGAIDALPPLIEQASRLHGMAEDCEFQLVLANARFEYDFNRNARTTSAETCAQLARACEAYEGLGNARQWELPNHVSREAARLRDLLEFSRSQVPAAASCQVPGPPVTDAAVVMLIKDEGDIIYPHLHWHYRLGLRNYVILNNGSTDATAACIRAFQGDFPEALVYVIDDPMVAYYQSRKTTAAAHFARAMFGVDWIIPLDGDEILTAHRASLAETLAGIAAAGHDYVVAHRCDYSMTPLDDQARENPLARLQYRQTFLTPCPKVLVRFRDGLRIEVGNHEVKAADNRRLSGVSGLQQGLVIRHFPLRSREHIRRKIINGGQALAAAELESAHGDHWRFSYNAYKAQGEAFIDAYYRANVLDAQRLAFDPMP
ncbi:MAG: tetratricopeptide repeat protein [Methylococcaceae bacterium]|nr:tetratricopeptide repeat protein [Methylococcaceae bacterium]